MTVAIVTPWFEHRELTDGYFAAVAEADEVIIVDNGSTPPLEFASIRLETNSGFCHASNLGLERASSDVVVFLNNDIAGGNKGWLQTLAAAVRPHTLAGARMRHDAHAHVDGQPLPYLDGWCLAGMREDLLELGGFNETLTEPAYYSDNLLCLEARARGFTLTEVETGLTHLENATAAEMRDKVGPATHANWVRYVQRARELTAVHA